MYHKYDFRQRKCCIEKCCIVEIKINDSLNKHFISNLILDDSSCAFPNVIDKNNTNEINLELSEPLAITELSTDDSGFITYHSRKPGWRW